MSSFTHAKLEERVAMLLQHTDKMREHIVAHEFSLAADEARALEIYCNGATVMANRLADEDSA